LYLSPFFFVERRRFAEVKGYDRRALLQAFAGSVTWRRSNKIESPEPGRSFIKPYGPYSIPKKTRENYSASTGGKKKCTKIRGTF
jgi:hypothetical protein